MKLAYVVDRFPVLSETFIINQITGLIDRGHDVDIYAKSLHAPGAQHADVARYGLLERTSFWPELPRSKVRRVARAVGLWARELKRRRASALVAADAYRYGVEALSGNLTYGAANIDEGVEYDAIHAHFANVGVRAQALRAQGLLRGPLATTFHGFDLSHGIRGTRAALQLMGYRELLRRGDLFLPVSERWRRRLIDLGCAPTKVVVHRMGIDLTKFSRVERPRSTGPIRLLSVARLVEKKGIAYAIEAVERLTASGTGVEYVIVGDGPERAQLEARASGLRSAGTIRFTGTLPHADIATRMEQADLLLVPSVVAANGDQEGLPVVIMEAMARGVVVVATTHSGIPELVIDKHTGYLAPERDARALADTIGTAISERDAWPRIRDTARAAVDEKHDIAKLNDRLVDLLALLGRGAK